MLSFRPERPVMLKTKCVSCGSQITPNMDKLTLVLGGGAVIAVIAAAFGLAGGGFIALGTAMLGGSTVARYLLQAKMRLLRESGGMALFKCSGCGRDAPIAEIFADV